MREIECGSLAFVFMRTSHYKKAVRKTRIGATMLVLQTEPKATRKANSGLARRNDALVVCFRAKSGLNIFPNRWTWVMDWQ